MTSTRRQAAALLGVVSICLGLVLGLTATTASAAPKDDWPMAYTPVDGEVTYDGDEEELKANCPEGIAATPGSDPASKYIDFGDSDLDAGDIHYVYDDNNSRTDPDFKVQDCVVVYPESFFDDTDFNSDGQFIGDLSKHDLTKGGEVLDQATLSGSDQSDDPIHFRWQAPEDLVGGDWVCNFARDINNQHQGGGNRKVPPSCYQVPDDPRTETRFVTPAEPVHTEESCQDVDTYTIPTRLHVTYLVDGTATDAGTYDLEPGDIVVITVEVEEGYTLTAPPEGQESWTWTFTGSDTESCRSSGGNRNNNRSNPTTTTSTTSTTVLAFTPEPEVQPEVLPETLTTEAPQLPFTGSSNNGRLAAVAAALLSLGTALVIAGRRSASD